MKFVEAQYFTPVKSREIDLIVIHTMEAPEKPTTAEGVARWFAGKSSPRASAHYCIDNNTIVQCVWDHDVAWAAPGANHNGLQFEHAGYSSQSVTGWDDAFSRAMLNRSAHLAAQRCHKYDVPVKWLTPAALKRGERGITTHLNVSLAFKLSDHHDPGINFPRFHYIKMVKEVYAELG